MSSIIRPVATPQAILLQPHKVLSATAEPAAGATPEVLQILENMLATVYRADGVGIAAPQIGVSQRLVVIDIGAERDDGKRDYSVKRPTFYINPEILWSSEETSSRQEGCLSLPGLWGDVVRPSEVKIRYTDRDGAVVEEELGGLASVCIQHEIDHLDGILFTQRMTKLRRDLANTKWQKLRRDLVKEGGEFDVIAAETGLIKSHHSKDK